MKILPVVVVGIKHESMRKGQTSHKKEHNTRMCFPLKPVFTRDKGGLPNFIDEPTTGLDPQTRLLIWDIIEKLRVEEKLTVFLTTHYMEEAANAGYVVILDKGSIVAEGTPFELKNEYVQDTMSVYGVTEEEIKTLGREYKKIRDGYQLKVKNTAEATRLIVEHQEIFRDYEVVKGRMDDVFLAVTGKTLGGEHR